MSDQTNAQPAQPAEPAEPAESIERLAAELRAHTARVEALLGPERRALAEAEKDLAPAWRRLTEGEPRWPVTVTVLLVIVLQLTLPANLSVHPVWLLPAVEAALLIALIAANPGRLDRPSPVLRAGSLTLIAVIGLSNAWSVVLLIRGLVGGTVGEEAGPLLVVGATIWLINVVIFALCYWEFDRGGPVARAHDVDPYPDFLFAQMQSPELAPESWAPHFVDYAYLSFTNATAFSPTDVLPLTRWTKLTMLVQSAISLTTVALVIARAVNILK